MTMADLSKPVPRDVAGLVGREFSYPANGHALFGDLTATSVRAVLDDIGPDAGGHHAHAEALQVRIESYVRAALGY